MEKAIYDKFRALADKKRLTSEDKETIEAEAVLLGITLDTKCPNCYHDAAVQIALAYKPSEEPQDGEYELCDGIDIVLDTYRYGRLRVNKQNSTPANIQKWLEAGIPLRYFKKYPHDDNGSK